MWQSMWQRFKMSLIRFMDGRYGTDQLNRFLIFFYLGLIIINYLIALIFKVYLSFVMYIGLALMVWALFRTFSRNIAKRQEENAAFIRIRGQVMMFLKRQFNRVKELKTHRYRKCPHCKAVLRLKRQTGELTVNCPRCHDSFQVKIRF